MTRGWYRALGLWGLLAVVAIANGLLREYLLAPLLGPARALPASGITLALLIVLVAVLALPWLGALTRRQYWAVGLLWLLLTLLFEVLFGRLVAGKSWRQLAAAYDLAGGNLWLLVLAATLTAPRLAAGLRRTLPGSR